MSKNYETCRHVESVGAVAVFVNQHCPRANMIKGRLVSSRKRCETCMSWRRKEGKGDAKTGKENPYQGKPEPGTAPGDEHEGSTNKAGAGRDVSSIHNTGPGSAAEAD